MRKKTGIFLFLLAFLVLIGILIWNNVDFSNLNIGGGEEIADYSKLNPVIIQYKVGTYDEIKTVNIDLEEDKIKLSEYVKKLKPLSKEEMVNLALPNEIVIKYDDNLNVYLTLDPYDYCSFDNLKKDIHYKLSKIPDGLRLFVKDHLGIKD
ncbi:MAG: hypothetical protein IKI57_02405 [Clostridia bacterium]|nr:hypothetical protein [Clostridia bacterium]